MKTTASISIQASKESAWSALTNISKSQELISSIKSIEILNQPNEGLVGLKWKETREMFGKEAIETMWIIESVENKFYIAEALNCGCRYLSRVEIKENADDIRVQMSFEARPQTFLAKMMMPMMFLMKGMIKKAFEKDLLEIKEFLEKK